MELKTIFQQAQADADSIKNQNDLENWRVKYLGRKSAISLFFKELSSFSPEEKKEKGKEANKIKESLLHLFKQKQTDLEINFKPKIDFGFFDFTRPGEKISQGHLHPLTTMARKIIRSFEKTGFEIVEGPEIETEYYNFDALNIPPGHPAREMWDTLWIKPKTKNQKSKLLLRTHTSPVQIRYMETHQPPFRIIAPGRCYRHEATDASHEIQFHQIEGLMVGENISLANFKAVIETIIKDIFKNKVLVRFRPSYFPFVSPGIEVDIKINSKFKNQKSKLKDEWLEIMGAGMVHPELFKRVGYEANRWQGFAFGLGIERIAIIKYGICDIRMFFNSDIRFLKQF